jgi:nitrite reductase/ring-hydroxylating ferredoxin subunit
MPNWIRLADADDCPVGEGREYVAGGRIIALFNIDGELFAIDGICPHQGGPLGKGVLAGCIVTCPWHGFQFDVRDGQHTTSKQLRQPTFEVKVDDSAIYVDLP